MTNKTLDSELIVDAKFEDIPGKAIVQSFRNTEQSEVQSSRDTGQYKPWEHPLLQKISFAGVIVGLYHPFAQFAFPEHASVIYDIGVTGAIIGVTGMLYELSNYIKHQEDFSHFPLPC